MSKRRIALISLLLLPTISILACGASSNEPPVYRVTKSTGLYGAANPDAELLVELPIGTLLKPANGEKSLQCHSVEEFGATYNLCIVEIVSTGEKGWVLRQWIERE